MGRTPQHLNLTCLVFDAAVVIPARALLTLTWTEHGYGLLHPERGEMVPLKRCGGKCCLGRVVGKGRPYKLMAHFPRVSMATSGKYSSRMLSGTCGNHFVLVPVTLYLLNAAK